MSTFAMAGLIKVTFTGINGSGPISVPGLKAGDIILGQVLDTTGAPEGILSYETIISVDDQIQQNTSADRSGIAMTAVFSRFG